MISPLPPYTVAVYREEKLSGHREFIAVKRLTGHWDLVGTDAYWFDSDEELFEEWPEVEIIGEGIWPSDGT